MSVSITSQQKSYLRGLAHEKKPVVRLGEKGLTDAVVKSVEQALLDHELIKVRLDRPDDKKSQAQSLAERTGAVLCGLIGHTVILYRPHPEKPRIHLP